MPKTLDRWDSDHVVLFDDETREMMKEVVRADALDRVFLATDYFDASINRISAWVTGLHSVQKALLYALLEPKTLKALQDANNFTEAHSRRVRPPPVRRGQTRKAALRVLQKTFPFPSYRLLSTSAS